MLKEYGVHLRKLMEMKEDVLLYQSSEEAKQNMLRAVNIILNWESDLKMRSDAGRKQSSIIAWET